MALQLRAGLAPAGLVGQALLPVRVCSGEIEPDRQECLSY
jgi:hypothetical protein